LHNDDHLRIEVEALGDGKYLAPEALKSSVVAEFTDIYALGLTIYSIVNTFIEKDEDGVPIIDFTACVIPVSQDMEYIIRQCISSSYTQRPSAQDVMVYAARHLHHESAPSAVNGAVETSQPMIESFTPRHR